MKETTAMKQLREQLRKGAQGYLEIDNDYFGELPESVVEYSPELYNSIMAAYMVYASDNDIHWSFPQLFSTAGSDGEIDEFMDKFGWFQFQYLEHINSPLANRMKPQPKYSSNNWR